LRALLTTSQLVLFNFYCMRQTQARCSALNESDRSSRLSCVISVRVVQLELSMKFSLFYEMQISNPSRDREMQLFRDCVDQAVLADSLGYHCVWAVEHHGLYEYAHSSAPEIFLSFVAARTKRIRIGHGVTLTPHRFNHPIRIAERVATLDILSEGRVNWGSGKSSSNVEPELFEIDPNMLDSLWEEALRMIPLMWRDDAFSWNGRHYRISPTHIVPKPVQNPHPPIFTSTARPQSLVRAGQMGVGVLNFSANGYQDLRNRVLSYKNAAKNACPSEWQKNDRFCMTTYTCVLPDDNQACTHGFTGANYFRDSYDLYYNKKIRPPVGPLAIRRDPISLDILRLLKDARNDDEHTLSIIGDPIAAREKVSMFHDAGVDEVLLIMQLGLIPNEIIRQSLRCFAEEVMSHFS
jgi:alkanesulfonate monooxygenase SsuD/methylene tetrahydromethanopterin reductase-like flavin-dependent oxidoreductase (luciferase family)